MSQRHSVQDASGVVIVKGPNDVAYIISNKTGPRFNTTTGNPVNGQPGCMTGCFCQNPFGTPGNLFFVNQGTNVSSTWVGVA